MLNVSPSQDHLLALAKQHHEAGRLSNAEALYRQILQQNPGHSQALHMLGVLAMQVQQPEVAVDLMRQAIVLRPEYTEACNNLGYVLNNLGRFDEAIAVLRQAISVNKNLAEVYNNLALALTNKGQLDEAIASCRQAIILKPGYPEAYYNLANALADKGHLDQAIAAYRQAMALKPDYPQASYNLGTVLARNAQPDEAIFAYQKAIALKPDYPEALQNLGVILEGKGQFDQAIAAYRKAVVLNPNCFEACNNLGVALWKSGQFDSAIATLSQLASLNPENYQVHCNLGIALVDQGRPAEAVVMLRRALSLKPGDSEGHCSLGDALRGMGQLDAAAAEYRQAIALCDNYPQAHNNLGTTLMGLGQLDAAIMVFHHAISLRSDLPQAHSNLAYTLHFHPGYDAQAIAGELERWNHRHAQPLGHFAQPHANDRRPERPLRVGYVSPDFRAHVVGQFLLPLLRHHDRHAIKIYAYSNVPRPDPMTERLRACTDVWRNLVGMSDEKSADLVRQDRIDILVDLAMHTSANRLLMFARKPAPVQVCWLAYPGSTGLSAIDYRLSDPYLDPIDAVLEFSEQTARLPETFWCYQPIDNVPEVNTLPASESGRVTFGCLNNFAKVSEPALATWARILQSVPRAQLLLHAPEGSARRRVQELMETAGVETARIRFAAQVPSPEYFQLYHGIDIALDPFPCAGGTTTCDALYMGVPVVSLIGTTPAGRSGFSILSNIGLPELAAGNEEGYERIARELAGDVPLLRRLRSTLRHHLEQSPLMDGPRFSRNVETAYRQMWQTWCMTSGIPV